MTEAGKRGRRVKGPEIPETKRRGRERGRRRTRKQRDQRNQRREAEKGAGVRRPKQAGRGEAGEEAGYRIPAERGGPDRAEGRVGARRMEKRKRLGAGSSGRAGTTAGEHDSGRRFERGELGEEAELRDGRACSRRGRGRPGRGDEFGGEVTREVRRR